LTNKRSRDEIFRIALYCFARLKYFVSSDVKDVGSNLGVTAKTQQGQRMFAQAFSFATLTRNGEHL